MGRTTDFAMVGDRMMAEGLRAWLCPLGDLRLVAATRTVEQLLARGGEIRPQVLLLELRLSDGSDVAANVRRLSREGYPVIVIGARPRQEDMTAAITAGARGYLTKDQELLALADAIRTVAAGGLTYSLKATDPAADGVMAQRPRLSARELAVLRAYVSGMTLEAAARHVGIRPATAKTYLARVKAKYEEIGRPAYTKLELAARVREDCP